MSFTPGSPSSPFKLGRILHKTTYITVDSKHFFFKCPHSQIVQLVRVKLDLLHGLEPCSSLCLTLPSKTYSADVLSHYQDLIHYLQQRVLDKEERCSPGRLRSPGLPAHRWRGCIWDCGVFTQRQHFHKAPARAQNQGPFLYVSCHHHKSARVYSALPSCGVRKYSASLEGK